MRRSILYAPRVRGDLDLGLEPSRLDGNGNQQWAEINAPGGRLSGGSYQGHWEASTTQNYRIGSRRVVHDRTYHYAHVIVGGTGLTAGWGAANIGTLRERAADTVVVGGVVGTLSVTLRALFDVVEDEFAGGFIMYGADAPPGQSCMIPIVSNSAALTGANYVVVLEHGLTGVLTAGQGITVVANIWANVDIIGVLPVGSAGFQTVVGLPTINVVADSYTWLQTWGMCIAVNAAATGDVIHERMVYFNVGGGIMPAVGHAPAYQLAGVLATRSWYAAPGVPAAAHAGNTFFLMLFP